MRKERKRKTEETHVERAKQADEFINFKSRPAIPCLLPCWNAFMGLRSLPNSHFSSLKAPPPLPSFTLTHIHADDARNL